MPDIPTALPSPAPGEGEGGRPASGGPVAFALLEARRRRERQRRQGYPLQLAVLLAVVVPALLAHPAPGMSGRGLAITIALVVYTAGVAAPAHGRTSGEGAAPLVLVLACIGAAGVTLAALQPQAASELPGSAAVLMAAIRLPSRLAALLTVPVTAGLAVAVGVRSPAQDVTATILLCVVLSVLGGFVRQARANEDRTSMLLAELEEARDDQARAAAVEERSRIARELHDVLAHSLSGLALQLEGARRLAATQQTTDELRAVIDRSASLAKEGLVEARGAVGALRDDDLLTVTRLPLLVEHYRTDLGVPVDLDVEGAERTLPADVSLTLYRVAGEALTNVVRHAPGAAVHVRLRWGPDEVGLRVTNGAASGPARPGPSSGWGLIGVRERVGRVGGRVTAGPDGAGWSLDVTVPA